MPKRKDYRQGFIKPLAWNKLRKKGSSTKVTSLLQLKLKTIIKSKSKTKDRAFLTSRRELIINPEHQMARRGKLNIHKVKVISH